MGKTLTTIAGILCLIGSFIFAWVGDTSTVYCGLGLINIGTSFNMLVSAGQPILYIGFFMGILTILSGVFILIGRKSRLLPILFGLIAFIQMLLIILLLLEIEIPYLTEAIANPVEFFYVEHFGNAFPVLIEIINDAGLGAFILCGGALLAIIGGLTNKKD